MTYSKDPSSPATGDSFQLTSHSDLIRSPNSSMEAIGYSSPPSGPSHNVIAVWAVLSQNYPNAYKKNIDKTDPGGVWAENLDRLTSGQMERGLRALARYDEKWMPNAPTCRKIIEQASADEVRAHLAQISDDVDKMFSGLRRAMTGVWLAFTIEHADQVTDAECGATCYNILENLLPEYEQVLEEEPDAWEQIVETLANVCLPLWAEACRIRTDKLTLAKLREDHSQSSSPWSSSVKR